MDNDAIKASLGASLNGGFHVYERRSGDLQLIAPISHEDGDMVDIYLQSSPDDPEQVRICDFGMALMRLSYNFEINTPVRRSILDSILINSGVQNDEGNLYLDTSLDSIYEGILQFAGCVQRVSSMSHWSREVVRSAFYENLAGYISDDLGTFAPVPDVSPLPGYPISVDWQLTHNQRNFYVFGVRGNDKAKNVTIALLEFQKANLPFISLVVHEDLEDLGWKETRLLTANADTQYPALDDFRERAPHDIARLAGVVSDDADHP